MKQGKLTPEDDQDENNDEAWPGCWGKYHPECPFAVSLIEDPNEEWEEERDGEKERKAKEVEFETNYRVSLKKYTQDESLVTYCEEDRGRHLNNVLGILTGKKKSPHTYVLKKEFLESFVWEGCRRAFLGAFAVLNTDVSKYLGEDGEKASREYTKALQQAYSQLNQKNSRSYLVGQDTGGINIRFNYAIGNLSTAVIKHSEDVAGRGKKVRGKDQDYGWQKCYTHGDIELLGVSTWQNKLALLQEGNSREGFQDDARSKEEELRGLVPKFSVQDTAIGVASSTSSADPIHILKQVMFLLQNQALNENRANGKADPIARANLLLGDISKLILKRVRVEGEKITIFGRKKSPPAPPGPQQDGPQQHPPQQDGPQQDPPQQDPPQQDRPQSPDEPPPPDVDYATEDMFSPASMSSLPEVAQMDETVGGGDGIGNLSSAARLLQQEIFTPVNQSGAQEQWTPEQRTENQCRVDPEFRQDLQKLKNIKRLRVSNTNTLPPGYIVETFEPTQQTAMEKPAATKLTPKAQGEESGSITGSEAQATEPLPAKKKETAETGASVEPQAGSESNKQETKARKLVFLSDEDGTEVELEDPKGTVEQEEMEEIREKSDAEEEEKEGGEEEGFEKGVDDKVGEKVEQQVNEAVPKKQRPKVVKTKRGGKGPHEIQKEQEDEEEEEVEEPVEETVSKKQGPKVVKTKPGGKGPHETQKASKKKPTKKIDDDTRASPRIQKLKKRKGEAKDETRWGGASEEEADEPRKKKAKTAKTNIMKQQKKKAQSAVRKK